MLVEYVLRVDADRKPGGDIVQARRYQALMKEKGIDSRVSIGVPRGEGICHAFSVDRPVEFVRIARMCGRNRPLVVSAIHHSAVQVARFRAVRRGLLGLAERRLPTAAVETVKDAMRTASSPVSKSTVALPTLPTTGRIRAGLDTARSVQVLADGETRWLREDFGYVGETVKIPNGIDVCVSEESASHRDIDVVVVGRVEERKNQVAIADALSRMTSIKAVFVGSPNHTSTSYVREFQSIVSTAKNLTWVGGRSQSEVREMLLRTRVYLSGSFFEVLSLADLEAAASGCTVIASQNGNTREFLGESAFYVDPWRIGQQLFSLIGSALGAPASCVDTLPTWQEVADDLVAEYVRIGS